MSSGDELGRKPQPKDALTLDPQVCAPEPEGRLDKIWPVDLGEQVVGSKHEFEVPPPRNLSSVAAVGQASVSGSSDVSVAWPMSMLGAGVLSGPLRLTYAPSAAGVQRATLTLIVKWTDGHVETRHVQVTARARAIEGAPESHKDDTTAFPVRISLHGGLTIITVDEAGRVRVAGAPLMHKGSNTEIQQLKEAQHIVDVVMSKTLAAWGVQQVQTNDARQPAIKQKESAPI